MSERESRVVPCGWCDGSGEIPVTNDEGSAIVGVEPCVICKGTGERTEYSL